MTRILLVETASPRRVRKKAEEILAGGIYADPEVTILCGSDATTFRFLAQVPGIRMVALERENRRRIRDDLNGRDFDVLYVFWTGERRYRRMKLFALRLKARVTHVDSGDGGVFRLTWKACIRHWQFRRAHPLPTDHWTFYPAADSVHQPEELEESEGERILLVQSAEPSYLLRALEQFKEKPLFRRARYVLFCRNRPEVLMHFRGHPMICEIRTHSETRESWKHLRELRKERFDAVVVFFTGDPSYWKIKWFAFLLGVRHKLIFNEYNGCFYFTVRQWLALLSHRLGARSRTAGRLRWTWHVRVLAFLVFKVIMIPFRFLWLLLVWLRLRIVAAWIGPGAD